MIMQILIIALEYIAILFLANYKLKYVHQDSLDQIRKIYEFLTFYYNSGSFTFASIVFGEKAFKDIIKSLKNDISLSIPFTKEKISIPILSRKELTSISMDELMNKLKREYSMYKTKIEIYSIIIVSILIFPNFLLLTLTILYAYSIVYLIPIIQITFLFLLTGKIKWMKKK